jgi:starvation-inducible DNA-binding protein
MNELVKKISLIMADTYALYLKTQNYHWHVKGAQFKTLHELFEMQYQQLASAVDTLAERIVMTGNKAPSTFQELQNLKQIKDGEYNIKANTMVTQLAEDHTILLKDLNQALETAQKHNDEGTATLLGDRIVEHEKMQWMLRASEEVS